MPAGICMHMYICMHVAECCLKIFELRCRMFAGQGKEGLVIVRTDDIDPVTLVYLNASRGEQERDSDSELTNAGADGEQYDRVFLHDVPISIPKYSLPTPFPSQDNVVQQLVPILQQKNVGVNVIGAKLIVGPGADCFCHFIVDTGPRAIEVKLMVCQHEEVCSLRDPYAQIPQEATHFLFCHAMQTTGAEFEADLSSAVSPILRLLFNGGFVYYRGGRTAQDDEQPEDRIRNGPRRSRSMFRGVFSQSAKHEHEMDNSATGEDMPPSNQDVELGEREIEVIALKAIEWVPRGRLASQKSQEFIRLSSPKTFKKKVSFILNEKSNDRRRWVSSIGDSFSWVSAKEGSEEFPADMKTLRGGFLWKKGIEPNEQYLFYPLCHDHLQWPSHSNLIPLEVVDLVTKMLRVISHLRARIGHVCEELRRYRLLISKEGLSAAIAARRKLMVKITERLVAKVGNDIFAYEPSSKELFLSREISDVFDQAQHQVNVRMCARESCDSIAENLGLNWKKMDPVNPRNGRELSNPGLATALESRTEFTQQEWDEFGITSLHTDDFIKVGGSYFKPAAASGATKAGSRPNNPRLKTVLYTICDMSSRCAFREMLEKNEMADYMSPASLSPQRPKRQQRGFGPTGQDNFLVRIYSITGFPDKSGLFDRTDPYVRYSVRLCTVKAVSPPVSSY